MYFLVYISYWKGNKSQKDKELVKIDTLHITFNYVAYHERTLNAKMLGSVISYLSHAGKLYICVDISTCSLRVAIRKISNIIK